MSETINITNDALELLGTAYDQPGVDLLMTEMREKDQETYLHCVRTAIIVSEFTTSGLIDESAPVSALLHDLGKMGIGNECLYKGKSEPLTIEEMASFKAHPMRGFLRCAATPGITPRDVLPILIHHIFQESGYPNVSEKFLLTVDVSHADLMSEDVMKSALAIAVADKLDAMHPMHKGGIRSYRKISHKVDELTGEIWNDFEAAGIVRKLGMTGLLADLLGYSQTTFLVV